MPKQRRRRGDRSGDSKSSFVPLFDAGMTPKPSQTIAQQVMEKLPIGIENESQDYFSR